MPAPFHGPEFSGHVPVEGLGRCPLEVGSESARPLGQQVGTHTEEKMEVI